MRTRLYKAIKLARLVCQELGIQWTPFTRQQLRPTAITQTDKALGRDEARRLAGHTTEKQTAHYIRHEAEVASAAVLPTLDQNLLASIEQAKRTLQGLTS